MPTSGSISISTWVPPNTMKLKWRLPRALKAAPGPRWMGVKGMGFKFGCRSGLGAADQTACSELICGFRRLFLVPPLVLSRQLLLHLRRHGLVVRQRQGIGSLAGGEGVQAVLVVQQLGHRHLGGDGNLPRTRTVGAADKAAAR